MFFEEGEKTSLFYKLLCLIFILLKIWKVSNTFKHFCRKMYKGNLKLSLFYTIKSLMSKLYEGKKLALIFCGQCVERLHGFQYWLCHNLPKTSIEKELFYRNIGSMWLSERQKSQWFKNNIVIKAATLSVKEVLKKD